jgi:hypothetical protein
MVRIDRGSGPIQGGGSSVGGGIRDFRKLLGHSARSRLASLGQAFRLLESSQTAGRGRTASLASRKFAVHHVVGVLHGQR